jgi:hypothetical protein
MEETGARVEPFVELPTTPQAMAEWLSGIPERKLTAAGLLQSQLRVIVARFYSNPPTLLDAIARGDLVRGERKAPISYKAVIGIAFDALGQIAEALRIKPLERMDNLTSAKILDLAATPLWSDYPKHFAVRRPMRIPPKPRELKTMLRGRWDSLLRWLMAKEINQWPYLDGLWPSVYGTRPDQLKRSQDRIGVAIGTLDFELGEKLTEKLGNEKDHASPENYFDDAKMIPL